ncbi:cytochrome c biogenesis protein CcdA [Mucisphaera sp.]|uniref:protein-disulfide reductase DsbD family protein n=1 Tax=Mucisphaera sp. TaxID=2913024 RepID=UPI003D0B0153
MHWTRAGWWVGLVLVAWLGVLGPGAGQAYGQFGFDGEIVTARAVWQDGRALPGDQRALAIALEIAEGFHTNPNAEAMPADTPYIPTVVTIEAGEGLLVGAVAYPEPEMIEVQYSAEPLASFKGQVVLHVPVVVADDAAAGVREVSVSIFYQACNDQVCFAPATLVVEAPLEVLERGADLEPMPGEAGLFAGFDPSTFASVYEGGEAAVARSGESLLRNDLLGLEFTIDTGGLVGVVLVLAVAFGAGVLLNVTPCVLPVIPIKVMSLHKAAGDRKRALFLGLVYSLGIVLAFFVLGLLVAGLISGLDALEWGQIFSYPPVSAGLGVIIVVMGLGMMGLFSFRLPSSVYALNPSSDTAMGNLLLGVLTAVLSTPCTGPMLGATIAWAVKQPAALSLGTFVAVGMGMAAPYLLLSAFPGLVDRLPRSGPGSELVKRVMGGLLIAVAVFFFGPLIPGRLEWWVIAGLIGATMLYMVWVGWGLSRRWVTRVATVAVAVVVTGSGYLMASVLAGSSPVPWQTYTVAAFEQARADGKHVLLKFTADWCGNCHYLEGTLYRRSEVVGYFDDPDYVAFKVDLTASDAEGWPLQRELGGGGGIPLAAVYHPGQAEPDRVLQGLYTLDQLLAELEPETSVTAAGP